MRARRRGYTLLELVVVLAILALTGAVALPAFAAWRPVSPLAATTGELTRAVALARGRAVGSGAPVELVLDAGGARAWLHPRDTSFMLALPDGCRLRGPARSRIWFDAGGPARGALPVAACGGDSARVHVDALSGEPQTELLP